MLLASLGGLVIQVAIPETLPILGRQRTGLPLFDGPNGRIKTGFKFGLFRGLAILVQKPQEIVTDISESFCRCLSLCKDEHLLGQSDLKGDHRVASAGGAVAESAWGELIHKGG